MFRALGKKGYLMIIFLISHGNYDVTPLLNRLLETVQVRVTSYGFMQN